MAEADQAGNPMMGGDDVKVRSDSGMGGGTPVNKILCWCKTNLLLILTIAGVVLGLIFGFAFRSTNPSKDAIMIISFPGEVLMRMLKMLIVPLVVSCMVTGLASLDARNSGRMGLRAIAYYFLTTFMAIILGIILVLSIHPGNPDAKGEERVSKQEKHPITSLDAFLDLFRNIFPQNILQAAFQHTSTVYKIEEPEEFIIKSKNKTDLEALLNSTLATTTTTTTTTVASVLSTVNNSLGNETTVVVNVTKWVRTFPMRDGVNVLGIITFFTSFGIIISSMGSKAKLMVDFFQVLNEIIMKMVHLVMWYSPIGIMFLIIGKVLELEDPAKVGSQLGLYMVTILLGLSIHIFLVVPGIYFVVTRKNPYLIILGMAQACVTAIGTSSSTATLPVTFRCLEENLNIDKRVTRFVLPIGATINMDGTALYEAVAPIFIAQMNGMDLTFGKIIAISLTATCASIGAAAIPSAGLVTMVMVLTSVGLPAEDISLILAVDWFLDRFRTATNVLGDSFGASIVAHLSKDELKTDQHIPVMDTNDAIDMQENGKRALDKDDMEDRI